MKVVTGEVMQEMDRRTIREYGVPGLVLMENAGRGCADAIKATFGLQGPGKILVVAGKGNNGGDGYVIARLLREEGWLVKTIVLAERDEITGDARANLDRLAPAAVVFSPAPSGLAPWHTDLEQATVVVDALLGTGLRSEVQGVYAEAISLMNGCGKPVVAVDIPSGIDAATGTVLGVAVKAALTVTFALAKRGHVLFPGVDHCGILRVVDIGIPGELAEGAPGIEYVDRRAARLLVHRRERNAHKGSFGHCLIIAGSTGKSGAAAMAANSAVRSGAGLVTLAAPAALNTVLEIKTTEAMTFPLDDGGRGLLDETVLPLVMQAAAGKGSVAIGPGLSWAPETACLVRQLVSEIEAPLVVDADGLNALSEQIDVLKGKRSPVVVLTPHPGEMARLAGLSTVEVEANRLGVAREFAARYGVYLLLKGARTVVAAPDGRIAINGSGNPGMASGGMGDVLTGVLSALLGQGYEAFDACCLGVFIHGHAADIVAAEKGEIGMSAVDVQEHLPWAFNNLIMQTGE
ncbi:bifunctional ADP-dependent NAD(P)H-hydrate dehydratase/NAD(P)H-hydrate epimerase [Geobacter pickeringii]|uniref:Bifunctional NAD(P)H-hydrate repair enzyme n=1 Tax=Geobacter pickeringii TaxID=345632 RepID=A0A0B5BDF2_9BACT|nr:bifunctional ADP-dependent NAD(P)H-hydrate dehydratase/NAD(P)H-hydrate epimerase [Geobacter pickeringii]AJE03154.1 ATP-binding protein [Geobacter pickeringii]